MIATAATVVGGPGYTSPKVFSATADPNSSNDYTTGADIGDIWVNTATGSILECVSVALGAAVWKAGTGVQNAITDPGNGGAIPVLASGNVLIVTAGAETRTLAAPTKVGVSLLLNLETFVGNCVITSAVPINGTGNTHITFTAAGESVELVAVRTSTAALRWAVRYNDGATLS